MRVDCFLADSVVSAEGKLYAQGIGWNVIAVPAFPAIHDRIGVGLVVHVPYTATNEAHSLEVRIETDGRVMALAPGGVAPEGVEPPRSIRADFNVGRPPQLAPGAEQLVCFAMNLNALRFEEAGIYEIVVTLDGSDDQDRLVFTLQQGAAG